MQLEKIFVVLGPPGSGKGTQSDLLAKFLHAPRIVVGDLIREFIKEDSDTARVAKERYNHGTPQPDEIATMLLERKLKAVTDSKAAVLDTFPLSMGQAEALDRIVKELGVNALRVIFLNVHVEEAVKRIMGRKHGRSDDDPEIARRRFEEYEKRNDPIKKYYVEEDVLVEIDGNQPIEKVHQDILNELGLV